MQFMDVLREVGTFGRFQMILLFVACPLVMLYGSFSYWTQIFILLVPDHRCRLSNSTRSEVGQCGLQRPLASEALMVLQSVPSGSESPLMSPLFFPIHNETFLGECSDGWEYDMTELYPTVVTEFDWVCKESWKTFASHSIYWAGSMVGYFVSGFAVDRYGRWRTILFLTLSLTSGFIGTLFPTNFATFSVARFVAGMSSMPLQTITYTLIMEYIEPTKRKLCAVLGFGYWLSGAAFIPWIAFLLRDWRLLTITGLLPCLPILYVVIKFVPESASWQLVKGETKQAVQTLKRIGEINNRPLSEETEYKMVMALEKESNSSDMQSSTVDLIRTPNMRKKTICLFVAWMLICMCYHGNNLNQANLPASIYLIYSLGALLELSSTMLHYFSVDRLGRKPPTILALLCMGIMGLLLAFFTPANPWTAFLLGILLRAFLSVSYNILHQIGAELFPTCLRGRGICLMRTCGDFANTVGPYLVSMASVNPVLPQILFSSLAVVGSVVILFLPETLNQDLPQTVEDAEAFGRDQGICFCPGIIRCFRSPKCDVTAYDNEVMDKNGNVDEKQIHVITIPTLKIADDC